MSTAQAWLFVSGSLVSLTDGLKKVGNFWKCVISGIKRRTYNKKLEVNDKGAQGLISVALRGTEQFPGAAASWRPVGKLMQAAAARGYSQQYKVQQAHPAQQLHTN